MCSERSTDWIVFRVLVETSVHAGHLDIVREMVDGRSAGPQSRGNADVRQRPGFTPVLERSRLKRGPVGRHFQRATHRRPPTA
ncbi:mycothiol transferase [Pseudarthrobacter sp. ATCC 49987]|uniref:mycothiol transferase n=1 Tax=Pseudarthrobacter sp. ATCC 49987 TaxID=2698204 RepID=UPI001F31D745|nr:DUF664 domain-containing protein [Pseudarthrobacter sp. ATCC 49987]